MPVSVPTSADFADHETRIKALELAVFGTPNPTPVPETPANLQAVAGDGTVTLSWDASAGAVGYRIVRNVFAVVDVSELTFTDTGLTNGTTYSYQVMAFNSSGHSSPATITAMPTGGTPDPGWEHVTSDMGDEYIVDGRNVVIDGNAQVGTLHVRNGGSFCLPREVIVNDADLRSARRIVMDQVGREGWNKVVSDRTTVNGRRVYYVGQTADAICPASSGLNVGCPEAGLTNAQALAQHGVCRAGEIAPPEAHAEQGIEGLIV